MKKIMGLLVSTSLCLSVVSCANGDVSDENGVKNTEKANSTAQSSKSDDNLFTKLEDSMSVSNMKIGDIVTFGHYEQDNDLTNGKEPIRWEVVDIDGDAAMLVSCHVLDNLRYNEYAGINGDSSEETVGWDSSNIKEWLNGDFAKEAFNIEEQHLIIDKTDFENATVESDYIGNVFVLSLDELMKYYQPEKKQIEETNRKGEVKSTYNACYSDNILCQATPYALEKNVPNDRLIQSKADKLTEMGFTYDNSVIGKKYATYWLRDSQEWDKWFTAKGHSFIVQENGVIKLDVANLNNVKVADNGIRPCVWVTPGRAERYFTVVDGPNEDWMDLSTEEPIDDSNTEWQLDGNKLTITGELPEKLPWYSSKDTIEEIELHNVESTRIHYFNKYKSLKKVILNDDIERVRNGEIDNASKDLVFVYRGKEYSYYGDMETLSSDVKNNNP